MKLEIGSGYAPTPGFAHLDLNPNAPDVDFVGPAWPLDFPDGCLEELRAVDVLEHVSYWDTDACLAEWARVLVPGGRLFVQVPDAEHIMDDYVAAVGLRPERIPGEQAGATAHLTRGLPAGLPSTPLAGAAWRLLGGQSDGKYAKDGDDGDWNLHRALFDAGSLESALVRAGFGVESMESNAHPNLQAWAVKR